MRTTELFRTCANEHVAAAALASLGGRLRRKVAALARRDGVSAGRLVAGVLADYDRRASPGRRRELEQQMKGGDMPVLAGLRQVLEIGLAGAWELDAATSASSGRAATGRGWEAGWDANWAPHAL